MTPSPGRPSARAQNSSACDHADIRAALLQNSPASFGEFVYEVSVIGRSAVALLMRTCDVQVRPARQEIEAIGERIAAAAASA